LGDGDFGGDSDLRGEDGAGDIENSRVGLGGLAGFAGDLGDLGGLGSFGCLEPFGGNTHLPLGATRILPSVHFLTHLLVS